MNYTEKFVALDDGYLNVDHIVSVELDDFWPEKGKPVTWVKLKDVNGTVWPVATFPLDENHDRHDSPAGQYAARVVIFLAKGRLPCELPRI